MEVEKLILQGLIYLSGWALTAFLFYNIGKSHGRNQR